MSCLTSRTIELRQDLPREFLDQLAVRRFPCCEMRSLTMVNGSKRASTAARSPGCSGLAAASGSAGEENTILMREPQSAMRCMRLSASAADATATLQIPARSEVQQHGTHLFAQPIAGIARRAARVGKLQCCSFQTAGIGSPVCAGVRGWRPPPRSPRAAQRPNTAQRPNAAQRPNTAQRTYRTGRIATP